MGRHTLALAPRRTATVLTEDFADYTTNATWSEGGTLGQWRNQFLGENGHAKIVANSGDKAVELQATATSGTSSTLLTSIITPAGPIRITGRMRTLTQTGGTPNDWECAWLFWNYTDVPGAGDQGTGTPSTVIRRCYYLALKPQAAQGVGGWELGKLDQDLFSGGQRFLASAGSSNYPVGTAWRYFAVECSPTVAPDTVSPGLQIVVKAGNAANSLTALTTFVDGPGSAGFPTWSAHPGQSIYTFGAVGLYHEDAQVQFDDITVTGAGTYFDNYTEGH